MNYFINIIDNKVAGCSQSDNSRFSTTTNFQIRTTEEVYEKCLQDVNRYEYKDGKVVEIENYDEKKAKQERIAEIKYELSELDLKSIRAIRANDTEYIEKYETEAEALRQELKELNNESL